MTSHFSVVQYVPDPIADERINIGIIALGDGGIRCRFVRDWERAQRFGGKDVSFLKEFAQSVEQTVLDQNRLLPTAPPLDLSILERMATGWISSIQLTPPRGSVLKAGALLASVEHDYLKVRVPTRRDTRDKRSIAIQAAAAFSDALVQRFHTPLARELVTRDYTFPGRRDKHEFDVAIRNGDVFLGAYTISFGLSTVRNLHDQIKIASWDLADVRAAQPDLRLAIITSAPAVDNRQYKTVFALYEQTKRICDDYSASLVSEEDLNQVATEVADRIPASALPAVPYASFN